jgi:hypothetical protein
MGIPRGIPMTAAMATHYNKYAAATVMGCSRLGELLASNLVQEMACQLGESMEQPLLELWMEPMMMMSFSVVVIHIEAVVIILPT